MKRWVLEVGNTRAKWACFEADTGPSAAPLLVRSAMATDSPAVAAWFQEVATQDKVMVTGSGDLDAWASALDSAFVLRPGDPTPLNSLVTQRQTLGLDRVANAWAVLHGGLMDAPHHETWMIVDVGTCVTMDVVHRDQHLGGIISPGVQMRLQAMAQGTARLPQPDLTDQLPHPLSASASLGTHTQGALLRGALGGISAEIEGTWASLSQEFPNLGVALTGGDVPRLELRDILPKFADAHLTLKGFHALFKHLHA